MLESSIKLRKKPHSEHVENSFISELINHKALFIGNGNINGFGFIGLNLQPDKENHYQIYKPGDYTNLKRKHFDTICCHFLELKSGSWSYNGIGKLERDISDLDISCDTLVIDFLGEGFDMDMILDSIIDKHIYKNWNPSKIKILTPFYDCSKLKKLYPQFEFYEPPHELMGPLLFCSPQNHMIHNHEDSRLTFDITMGMEWNPNEKIKLFEWLNAGERDFRDITIHRLVEENMLKLGHISYLHGRDGGDIEQYPNLKTRKIKLSWEKDAEDNRFSIQSKVARETYVGVISESSIGELEFDTEKCMKPFYNLQFPIILGYDGIVDKLRKLGFDMFDDIIDHSYDKSHDGGLWDDIKYDVAFFKVNKIIIELKKLNDINIQQLYLKQKDRLIKNQELVYNYTVNNNRVLEEIAEFVFGKNIKCNRKTNNFNKIWLK